MQIKIKEFDEKTKELELKVKLYVSFISDVF